jgi:hypothetical protein
MGQDGWKDVAFYTLEAESSARSRGDKFIDFSRSPTPRPGRVGVTHCRQSHRPRDLLRELLAEVDRYGRPLPAAVSIFGLVALSVAGWFGGELVFVHSMGVKPPRAAPRSQASSSQRRIA